MDVGSSGWEKKKLCMSQDTLPASPLPLRQAAARKREGEVGGAGLMLFWGQTFSRGARIRVTHWATTRQLSSGRRRRATKGAIFFGDRPLANFFFAHHLCLMGDASRSPRVLPLPNPRFQAAARSYHYFPPSSPSVLSTFPPSAGAMPSPPPFPTFPFLLVRGVRDSHCMPLPAAAAFAAAADPGSFIAWRAN